MKDSMRAVRNRCKNYGLKGPMAFDHSWKAWSSVIERSRHIRCSAIYLLSSTIIGCVGLMSLMVTGRWGFLPVTILPFIVLAIVGWNCIKQDDELEMLVDTREEPDVPYLVFNDNDRTIIMMPRIEPNEAYQLFINRTVRMELFGNPENTSKIHHVDIGGYVFYYAAQSGENSIVINGQSTIIRDVMLLSDQAIKNGVGARGKERLDDSMSQMEDDSFELTNEMSFRRSLLLLKKACDSRSMPDSIYDHIVDLASAHWDRLQKDRETISKIHENMSNDKLYEHQMKTIDDKELKAIEEVSNNCKMVLGIQSDTSLEQLRAYRKEFEETVIDLNRIQNGAELTS
jgi:hypothetical protein